jgi:hypothetical protein
VSELPVVSQSVLDIVLIRIGIQHNVRMIYDSKKDRSHRCLIISRNGNTGQPDSASLLLAASCGISSWASGLEIGNSYRSAWYLVSVSSGTGLKGIGQALRPKTFKPDFSAGTGKAGYRIFGGYGFWPNNYFSRKNSNKVRNKL